MLGQSHTRPHTIILLGWPYKTRLLLFNIMQVAQPMHNPYALSIVLSIQKPGKEKLPSNRAEEGVWNATRILPLDYVFFVSYLSLYYIVHYNKSISFSLFFSFFSPSQMKTINVTCHCVACFAPNFNVSNFKTIPHCYEQRIFETINKNKVRSQKLRIGNYFISYISNEL